MLKFLALCSIGLAIACPAPLLAQPPPGQQNMLVALLIDPRDPKLYIPQVASGTCAEVMALQPGAKAMGEALLREGQIAFFTMFVVPIGWTLGQQRIDFDRCTIKQK